MAGLMIPRRNELAQDHGTGWRDVGEGSTSYEGGFGKTGRPSRCWVDWTGRFSRMLKKEKKKMLVDQEPGQNRGYKMTQGLLYTIHPLNDFTQVQPPP